MIDEFEVAMGAGENMRGVEEIGVIETIANVGAGSGAKVERLKGGLWIRNKSQYELSILIMIKLTF